jgi:hypothetical protein
MRGRRLCSARSDTVRGNWARDASIKLRRIVPFSAEPRSCRLVRVSSRGIRSTDQGAEQCNKHFSPWILRGRSVLCQIPASSGLNSARPDKFAQGASLLLADWVRFIPGRRLGDGEVAVAGFLLPSGREMVSVPKIRKRLIRKGDLPCGEVTGSCRRVHPGGGPPLPQTLRAERIAQGNAPQSLLRKAQ